MGPGRCLIRRRSSPGRNYVLVKILTDQPGLYGVGEGTLNSRANRQTRRIEFTAQADQGQAALSPLSPVSYHVREDRLL